MDTFLEGYTLRHACKVFDECKKIPTEAFQNILEVGLNAPSSFGMEPTRVMVIKSQNIREDIKPLCWNQAQITTASELVIFKTLTTQLIPPSHYVKTAMERKGKTSEQLQKYEERYTNYLKDKGYDEYNIGYWAALQSYITATAMMDYATYLKIDTCMIEGFEREPLEQYFRLDSAEQITLLLAFGYRIKPQSKRHRITLDEFVEYK